MVYSVYKKMDYLYNNNSLGSLNDAVLGIIKNDLEGVVSGSFVKTKKLNGCVYNFVCRLKHDLYSPKPTFSITTHDYEMFYHVSINEIIPIINKYYRRIAITNSLMD